jgi:hypothetical protein
MSAPPVEIPLSDYWRGDKWIGMIIGPIEINELPPPYAAASCRLHFRTNTGKLGYAFSSNPVDNEGTIIINNAATWSFTIEPDVLPLAEGDWEWDFEITDTAGGPLTPYKGSLKVNPDRTYG